MILPGQTLPPTPPKRDRRDLTDGAAETALTGHLLLDPPLAAQLATTLWSDPRHRAIHAAVTALRDKLGPMPLPQRLKTVCGWMSAAGRWTVPTWELTRFTSAAEVATDVPRLITQVTAAAHRRHLTEIGDRLHSAAEAGDPDRMTTTAHQAIADLRAFMTAAENGAPHDTH